ncbi:MAG: AI-2E family transporter [Rickettsiales bacterium]
MINRRLLFWGMVAVLTIAFVYLIRSVLLPFVLGLLIAYFLDPAADKLEKNSMSRGIATTFITAGFFTTLALLLLLIIPVVTEQLSGLMGILPEHINSLRAQYGGYLDQWIGALNLEEIGDNKETAANASGVVAKLLTDFVGGLFSSGVAVVNVLSLVLITPIVTFYMLRDWDRIVKKIDDMIPRKHVETVREQFAIIDQTLAGFVRGQLNVCLLLGTFYAIALSITGLKFAILIGLGTGLLIILPYVGFLVGFLVGMIVAIFQFDNNSAVLAVFGIFMAGQVLESYFLTPKLVGDKVGLHPVWIIFGMLAGAALFGFVGVLLAIPGTAVIGVLIRFALEQYRKSDYYHNTGT